MSSDCNDEVAVTTALVLIYLLELILSGLRYFTDQH